MEQTKVADYQIIDRRGGGVSVTVGEIKSINRYPVKSFAGEALESCKVVTYGVEGDRYCSFYDMTKKTGRSISLPGRFPK